MHLFEMPEYVEQWGQHGNAVVAVDAADLNALNRVHETFCYAVGLWTIHRLMRQLNAQLMEQCVRLK